MDSDPIFLDNNWNGTYEVIIYSISRENLIELANITRNSNSEYIRSLHLAIESELMVVRNL
jgi:hypothetical protein